MKAELVFHEKKYLEDEAFQEIKIWRVPKAIDKPHGLKYSFVYIVAGERVIGYDNAEGKGDHKHLRGRETVYKFNGLDKLWKDFTGDIRRYRKDKL